VIYGALVVMAFQTVQGAITLGALVMFFQVLQRGSGFMQDIMSGLAGLYEDNLFLGPLLDFLAPQSEVGRPAGYAVSSMPAESIIRFERVGFCYPAGEKPALADIEFELRPGDTVALVGANGSGKSTLIKLLCRLYDPSTGRITVGGTDLRELDPGAWRGRISPLFQDHVRYNASAELNIGISDRRAAGDGGAIRRAAEWAAADSMIEALPEKYRTVLGHWFSKGYDLSHGQWQRVALARALFRPASLLILDEPTNALDAASAALVLDSLREVIAGRTAVIVSHSFPAARLARTILVLDQGRIVERGSHDELLAANGRYATLFKEQPIGHR
jgi:ATP-binding cassette subfamily B protein